MAHSNLCCCRAVINRRSLWLDSWTGISRDMNFSHWRFPIRTARMETYVNVFRRDVLFVLHKLQCCFFCLSALSSVYVEEVSIRLFRVTKISREEHWGGNWGWFSTRHVSRWTKKGWSENSPHLNPPAGPWKQTPSSLFLPPSFSFSVWLSDHIKQWGLNPGQLQRRCVASDDTVQTLARRVACRGPGSDSVGIAYLP